MRPSRSIIRTGAGEPAAALVIIVLLAVCVLAPAGCLRRGERADAPGGTEQRTLTFGGRTRTYYVHPPKGYDPSRPHPLVLAFHGGTRNGPSMEHLTGLSPKADEEGFIAVYPNGTGTLKSVLTWNVGFGFGYALRNRVDDAGFVRALVERLEDDYSVDPARVYATGISNGGMLSYLVASDLSDIFAAVAPVAGAYGGRENEGAPLIVYRPPAGPVALVIFHGKKDRLVPYDGGAGIGLADAVYLPVADAVGAWVDWDGCSPSPATTTSRDGNVTRDEYTGGHDGTEVVLYSIADGGHAWPGGTPMLEGGDEATTDLDATDLIWEFFESHPKLSRVR
ncbi:MAG: prolyl oligopeptidase family serine peptidase [Actinobacteria bacterium]|nr:prolyl oligopeptidase family serine peptidase [Actinomycetota bacterium]MBU1943462.1 prolyl oligopeptidase family serine peptidase [Actinomycetota bacterium]MBU2686819.1 prolyl oligopeptidase family serine peptidase [Actinomycetota bacterium]